jgi:hypothetical protein
MTLELVERVVIGDHEWVVIPDERWPEWCARWEAEKPQRASWGERIITMKRFMPLDLWETTPHVRYLRRSAVAEFQAEADREARMRARWREAWARGRRSKPSAAAVRRQRALDNWIPCRNLGAWL